MGLGVFAEDEEGQSKTWIAIPGEKGQTSGVKTEREGFGGRPPRSEKQAP